MALQKEISNNDLKYLIDVNKSSSNQLATPNNFYIPFTDESLTQTFYEDKGRGIALLNSSNYRTYSGLNNDGSFVNAPTELPMYFLNVPDRIIFARMCAPVNSVITARMNKVSALNWKIVPKRKEEDRIVYALKDNREYYNEIKKSTDPNHLFIKAKLVKSIQRHLPEVLPDLSNFETSLIRFKRRINWSRIDEINEIWDWLEKPYSDERFSEITKKMVFDMMVHSSVALYKNRVCGRLENFHILPGGTVIKNKTRYVSNQDANVGYIQIVDGQIPQIMEPDELSYIEYLPISTWNMQLIPLESLINKILEYMDMDRRMRDEADGMKPPKKMVLIMSQFPIGDINKTGRAAINKNELNRIEKKMHKPVKNRVFTIEGHSAEVVDFGDDDVLSDKLARQKDIKEDVGLVFGATPMELNLSGSSDTSGRNTSEAQADIFFGRGIGPMVKSIEEYITDDIIRERYCTDAYMLEAEKGLDETQALQLDLLRLQTGDLTQNELRERENKSTFPGDQYNLPQGSQGMERGDEINPLNVRTV